MNWRKPKNERAVFGWFSRTGLRCYQCEEPLVNTEFGWLRRPEVFCSAHCRDEYRKFLETTQKVTKLEDEA